jgi:ankyrin repeat protein
MNETAHIAELYKKSFVGNSWHGPAVLEILQNVSDEVARAKPFASTHSIVELVVHISFWQNVVLRRIAGEIVEPSEKEDWNSSVVCNEETWKHTLAALKTGFDNLYTAILSLSAAELEKNIAGKNISLYETLHGIIHHNIYHAGQIALLKKEYTLRDPFRMLDAAEQGNGEKLKKILQRNPALLHTCDRYNKTPLHLTVENNHIEATQLLLDANADLEAETSWGMTPLQWAANCGSSASAELLLARGATMNLWVASALGKLEAVQSFWKSETELLENVGQPRAQHNENDEWLKLAPSENYYEIISDAFYIACRNGKVSVAEFLVVKGADINYKGFFGGTGLHWAALNGHFAMVEFLIQHNADLHILDDEYALTAMAWAKEGGHQNVIALLTPFEHSEGN